MSLHGPTTQSAQAPAYHYYPLIANRFVHSVDGPEDFQEHPIGQNGSWAS